MRSITNIAMALLLGTAMTACQGSPQNQDTPKVKAKAEAMETSGFDQTLANAKARVAARLGDPLAIPVPKDPGGGYTCLLYTSPSPRDGLLPRMPSSA